MLNGPLGNPAGLTKGTVVTMFAPSHRRIDSQRAGYSADPNLKYAES